MLRTEFKKFAQFAPHAVHHRTFNRRTLPQPL
jgi:hypothetical protein